MSSNNGVVKQGLRQQQRTLSERITGLEQGVARMLFGVNQQFGQAAQRTQTLEEQVEALVAIAGAEEVQAYITDRRIERARAQAAAEKASLDEGIKDGYVIPAETCGEKSVIVGRYFDDKGTVLEPGRAQLVMPGVQDQFKQQLLGKGTGTRLKLPEGGEYELTEIYEIDEAKAKEVEEAKAKAAAEAAAAQAQAQAQKDEAADAGKTEPPEGEGNPGDPEPAQAAQEQG